jgi:hypothetical protein
LKSQESCLRSIWLVSHHGIRFELPCRIGGGRSSLDRELQGKSTIDSSTPWCPYRGECQPDCSPHRGVACSRWRISRPGTSVSWGTFRKDCQALYLVISIDLITSDGYPACALDPSRMPILAAVLASLCWPD